MQVADNFPAECRRVLETLREVYKNDALAKKNALPPAERLHFHQTESGPLMTDLETWMKGQLAEHKIEPNSGLGDAIRYMLKHWSELTLFLQEPGAPLDNNICERALKKAILHRKNALFYKTLNGAHVGDVFMSLSSTPRSLTAPNRSTTWSRFSVTTKQSRTLPPTGCRGTTPPHSPESGKIGPLRPGRNVQPRATHSMPQWRAGVRLTLLRRRHGWDLRMPAGRTRKAGSVLLGRPRVWRCAVGSFCLERRACPTARSRSSWE